MDEFLMGKGYAVHSVVCRSSGYNMTNIDCLIWKKQTGKDLGCVPEMTILDALKEMFEYYKITDAQRKDAMQ